MLRGITGFIYVVDELYGPDLLTSAAGHLVIENVES